MKIFLTTLILIISISCSKNEEEAKMPLYQRESERNEVPTYTLAVHPLHNPTKLFEAYQPLINYLNLKIKSANFKLEASRDYQTYEEKIYASKPHLLLPNPWQTLQAMKKGYHVIAMAGEPEDFKGIFIVRKDTLLKEVKDLKGKKISCPSHTALAACIMPQKYLADNGINIESDIKTQYVGSQESSIMNVLLKEVSAGATWPPPWRLFQKDRPEEAKKLMVLWETPHLLNNSLMVRKDLPPEITIQIKRILYNLQKIEEGRGILRGMETSRFIEAEDKTYDLVRDFIKKFEKQVRKVEDPI